MAGKNRFLVGVFTNNGGTALREALKQQLQNEVGVTVVDYAGIQDELARKTVDWVDIAIMSDDSFSDSRIAAKTAMLLETARAAFMTFYDETNQAKVYEINEMLLKKRLSLLLTTRADEDEDFAIFAISVHSFLRVRFVCEA